MKRTGILNDRLCQAIASLGHGDGLLVVDAGFPIPADSFRIDLALVRDVPDLRTVLQVIADEMIVEGVVAAEDVPSHNAPLDAWLRRVWPDAEHSHVPHAEMLSGAAARAKAVVRTGAFDPWGNVLLISGVDVPAFFSMPGVIAPDYYQHRMPSPGEAGSL
jgi:D-ribose pyranase